MKILNEELLLKKIFIDLDIDLDNGKLITVQTWVISDKENDYYDVHWKVLPKFKDVYDSLTKEQQEELRLLVESKMI